MSDPSERDDPFRRVPDLWKRLLQSGFFIGDTILGEATPSRLMTSLGFQSSDFLTDKFIELIHPTDRATFSALWNRVSQGL